MIRYLLRIPKKQWEPPERPRSEVIVTLPSKTPYGLAELTFDGDEQDIQLVRKALLHRASGYRGAIIEANTTPINLAVAMDGPIMHVFQPERLEGGTIFQASASVFDEDVNRLAELIALLLSETLPLLPSFNDRAYAEFIEQLRLVLLLCNVVCKTPEYPDDAGIMLASSINARLASVGMNRERLKDTLRDGCEFLEIVSLDIPQTSQQVTQVLFRLEKTVSDPANENLSQICADLHSIWHTGDEF